MYKLAQDYGRCNLLGQVRRYKLVVHLEPSIKELIDEYIPNSPMSAYARLLIIEDLKKRGAPVDLLLRIIQ